MEWYCFLLLIRKALLTPITPCIALYPKDHLHPSQIILATLPSLGHTLKPPQRQFCLFRTVLSGIGLVKRSLLGLFLWGGLYQELRFVVVLLPELSVLLLSESGSDKLLKGQIPKGRSFSG